MSKKAHGEGNEDDQALQAEVVEIIDKLWLPMSALLYNISITLKSQGKLSSEEEKIQKLRPDVLKCAEYWTEEKDSMLPKMHQFLEHVLSFLDSHGPMLEHVILRRG